MGRKPNYRFERAERDRQKAAKKAERLKARQEKSGSEDEPSTETPPLGGEAPAEAPPTPERE